MDCGKLVRALVGVLATDTFWKVVTVLIAALVAYTAFRQFRLDRERLRLDLFEKRFAVFAGLRKFLTLILRDGGTSLENLFEYRASIAEASFLFGDDIVRYLDAIDKKALRLHTLDAQMKDLPVGHARSRASQENSEILGWLIDQLPELKAKFAPYLKFRRRL